MTTADRTAAQTAATRPAHPPTTSLRALAAWIAAELGVVAEATGEAALTGITLSSERVLPGDLYAALPGARAHGADFADRALAAGAVAVLTDPAGAERLDPDVP
ncbi:MAG: Mur ligase domain-containing protein, partial [Nocardioides sp.]